MMAKAVRFFTFLTGVLMILPVSLATAADTNADRPIFYPPPPNLPRIQFLSTFSSALDMSTKSRGFRDFVFGGEENEQKLVHKPYGLAIHQGRIYVVDARGNGWGVFDLAAEDSEIVQPSGQGALKKPINISIDDDGLRYVTDTDRNDVVVFDTSNRFLRTYGSRGQFKPIDVAVYEDRIYVSDT